MVSQAIREYMLKERERILDGLVAAALDVLHHDRTEGSDVDEYEREQLRKKFTEVLTP